MRTQIGLRVMKSLYGRAHACIGCHQNIDPEIVAKGHVPLTFEFDDFDPRAGRSADARAHEESVVLELSRGRFEALEAADPEGCAELSALLCRLAARRCVETAERLATWRVMAGPG